MSSLAPSGIADMLMKSLNNLCEFYEKYVTQQWANTSLIILERENLGSGNYKPVDLLIIFDRFLEF